MCKTLDDLMRALLVKQSFWNPQLRSVPRLNSSILWIKTSFRYNKTLELSQPTFVLAFTPGKLFIALKLDLWTLKLRLSRKTRFLANHTFVKRLVVGSVLHNLQTVFGSLILEGTALPTEPQTLPVWFVFYLIVEVFSFWSFVLFDPSNFRQKIASAQQHFLLHFLYNPFNDNDQYFIALC